MREIRFRIELYVWWLVVAAVLLLGVNVMTESGLKLLSGENVGIDDSNIYFRYARHIIAGEGVVWNVGSERVEGISSLLWLAVCVGVAQFSRFPERVLLALNIVLVALSLWASVFTVTLVAIARDAKTRSRFAYLLGTVGISSCTTAILLWWIARNPPFIVWNVVSLLETGLWGALLTTLACATTCYAVSEKAIFRNVSYATIVLVPWCRPEGTLLGAVGVVIFSVAVWSRGPVMGRASRFIARCAGMFAASVCALYSFRWFYFGYPFPNTYYAKVDGDRWFNVTEGWRYLTSFAEQFPYASNVALLVVGVSVATTVVVCLARLIGRPRWYPVAFVVWAPILAAGAFVPLWVGGDHFTWWRFLQPYWISLLVGALLLAERILPIFVPPIIRSVVVSLGAVTFLLTQPWQPGARWEDFRTPFGPEHEFGIATKGRSVGSDLNEIFSGYPSLPMVGSLTVGGVGYSYNGPINDLLGLNNVEMAHASTDRRYFIKSHSAFDKEVFLRQRPPFLFLMGDYCELARPEKTLETHDFYASSMKRVHESSEFQSLYVPVVVWNERLLKEGLGLCGYALRDELRSGRAPFGYKTL